MYYIYIHSLGQVSDISSLEMRRAFDALDSMKEGRLRVKDIDLVLEVYRYGGVWDLGYRARSLEFPLWGGYN